jgi:hypothetical protein
MMKEQCKAELITKLSEMHTDQREGVVFVDERIWYRMRDVTKRARKNYLGVYDEPNDPTTGEEKYWPPLTEAFCDGVIKSIDFDTKDIDLYSVNGSAVSAVKTLKILLRQKLKEGNFGTAINEFVRHLVIDGTGTLKFMDRYDAKLKRRVLAISAVDQLNIIADPSAKDLQSSFGVLERSLLNESQLSSMKEVWDAQAIRRVIDGNKGNDTFTRTFDNFDTIKSTAPFYPIYDYYGQVDKYWITGNENDRDTWIEGHAVVANLNEGRAPVEVLFIEENTKGCRPYGDVAIKSVIGRRVGRGIPEQLFGSQKYMNMLIDIRKKNAQILQNGLFKMKKSYGNTADTILSKIVTGGILQVNDMDDFQQMPIQDSRAASYSDEDRVLSWGERNTGQFDIRRGESLSASAPATTQLIQDRNSRDLYLLVQENVGLMLEEFIKNLVIPWIIDNVKDDEIISITGDARDLMEFDDAVTDHLVNMAIMEHIEKNGAYPSPEEVIAAREKQLKSLRGQGARRYVQLKKKMFEDIAVGVDVVVTNESMDKGTIVAKLQEMLTLAVTNPGTLGLDPQGIADTIFNILDVPTDRIYTARPKHMGPIDQQAAQGARGKVAPQVKSAGPAAPQGAPTQQMANNMTALAG